MTKFNEKVEKLVLQYGGVPSEFYKWKINTKAGLYLISVHEPEKSELFCIFACFDEPKRATSAWPNIYMNKHSGKSNFLIIDEKECLQAFEETLKLVTDEK